MCVLERFLRKVEVQPLGGIGARPCWIWLGARGGHGYGRFKIDGRMVQAHRFSYRMWIGLIPKGLEIDHLCRNPPCVNPDHIEAVSHKENVRRGRAGANWAAKTHCPKGHPLSGDNLYVDPRGKRCCRLCRRAQNLQYWHRQRGVRVSGVDIKSRTRYDRDR